MCSRIWRYFDLAKFVHLITSETLHFTRIDQFKDKFEGSYPLQNLKDWESKYPEVGDFKNYRNFACVSCWYESDHESAAMWELYGINGQGIAVCSTIKKLQSSLESDDVIYEKIQYIDFIKEKADILIPMDAFKYKRIEFECENEFRAILQKLPQSSEIRNGFPILGSVDKQDGYPEKGVEISVDLDLLTEKVVFSPHSKMWYRDTIIRLLQSCDLHKIVVVESELAVDPVYPKQ